jgi:hypothetical protein
MAALEQAALYVKREWAGAVSRLPLSAAEQRVYRDGIQDPTPVETDASGMELSTTIWNTAPNAAVVEYGYATYHLPSRIRWSQARGAKRSKSGTWYMAIPFRWLPPRTRVLAQGLSASTQRRVMRRPVYDRARTLRPEQHLTAGPTQGRAVHVPGLTPYAPRYARNIRPGYTHAAAEERMVRRPGRGRGSTYLTFRTITQNSPGWWIPARPAHHLADRVQRETMPEVLRMVRRGVQQDIEAGVRMEMGGPL